MAIRETRQWQEPSNIGKTKKSYMNLARKRAKVTYRSLLLDEFTARKKKNPLYSLRAFARDLAVSTTCLSDVLSGKRELSRKNALRVAEKLALSPAETNYLLNELGFRADKGREAKEFLQLDEDTFRLVSNWYYFPILSLCQIGKTDAKVLAQCLGITEFEARGAIERLKRLGLIAEENGRLVKTTSMLSTTRDIPSAAIRNYHKQNLKIAERSLENDPVNVRDFSAITFPADLKKLSEAKDLIMEFKRRLARIMETSESSEVYTLSIQLFPVARSANSDS